MCSCHFSSKQYRGFSLIELAIVMLISGILLAGALAAYKVYLEEKRQTELELRISQSQDALADFIMDNKCQVPDDSELVAYFGLSGTSSLESYHSRIWCQNEQPYTVNESSAWIDSSGLYGSVGDPIYVSGALISAWQVFPSDISLYASGGSTISVYENGAGGSSDDVIGAYLADAVRFPCPAPFQSISKSGFGREAYDIAATNPEGGKGTCDDSVDGIISVTGSNGETVFIGTLPTATLGVGSRYAIDPFGNLLTYAVSESLVAVGKLEGGIRKNGAIKIVDDVIDGNSITSNARFALVSHGETGNGAFPATGSDFLECDTSRLDSVNCPDWDNIPSRSVTFGGGTSSTISDVTFMSSSRWANSATLAYDNKVVSSLDYGVDGWLRQTDAESTHLQTKNVGNLGIGVTPSAEARLHVDGHYGDGTASGNAGVIAITGDSDSDLDAYSILVLGDDEKLEPLSSGWELVHAYDSSGGSTDGDLQIKLSGGTSYLVIDSGTGNVGIGTETPVASLDVGGQFVVDTTTGRVGVGTQTPVATLDVAGKVVVDSTTGYVGIGTQSPVASLDVVGGIIPGTQSEVTTCNSSVAGMIRYNTSYQTLQLCDGSNWVSFMLIRDDMIQVVTTVGTAGALYATATCPTGTVRVGCSGSRHPDLADNCDEGDCGLVGTRPTGTMGCQTAVDMDTRTPPTVYAFCLSNDGGTSLSSSTPYSTSNDSTDQSFSCADGESVTGFSSDGTPVCESSGGNYKLCEYGTTTLGEKWMTTYGAGDAKCKSCTGSSSATVDSCVKYDESRADDSGSDTANYALLCKY